jgi:hypothetical protein
MDGLVVLGFLVMLCLLAPVFGVDSRVRRDSTDPKDARDRAWFPHG